MSEKPERRPSTAESVTITTTKLGHDAIKAGDLSATDHEPLDFAAAAAKGRQLSDAYRAHYDLVKSRKWTNDHGWATSSERRSEADEIVRQLSSLRHTIFAETGVTPHMHDPGMGAYETSMILAATVAEQAAEAEFSLDKDDEDFLEQTKALVDDLKSYEKEHPEEDNEKLTIPYMQRFSVYRMKQTAKRLLVQSAARELLKRQNGEGKTRLTSERIKKLSEETGIDFASVEGIRDLGEVTVLGGLGGNRLAETRVDVGHHYKPRERAGV